MRKLTLFLFAIALIAAGCAGPAPSGQPLAKQGTLLRKIQERGKLIVGVKYDVPTFGYMNPQTKQVEGFDVAMGREIAEYIFGDPNKVEFKEAVTATRIANLQNGAFDVVLATMVISADRMKDIDFSVVYYQSGGRLLVAKESAIKNLSDLDASKKVGTSKGSVYVGVLGKMAKAQVLQFDTQAIAVQEMLAKRLDAVVANDLILYGLALQDPKIKVVGTQFTTEYVGAGVAKGNPELLNAVNTAIKNAKSSGKWKAIWKAEVGDKFGMTAIPEPPGDDWRVIN